MTTHSDRAHSSISPSKLKSIEISPAYTPDPTDPEHPVTAEGTLCHEALDSGDDSKLTTDEQREWVSACRDLTAEILPGAVEYRELKIPVLDGIWGFADLVRIRGSKGALVDYKFGFNLQEEVETNPAAQAYVYGLFKMFPPVDEFTVAYLYPRLGQVSTCTYARDDMSRIETRIRLTVEKAREATPETCRWSAETCRFCLHRKTCPTLRAAVLPVAQRYAETHDIRLPLFDTLDTLDDPAKMARLLEAAPVLEAVADSIKRNAVRLRVEGGTEIPGWELRTRAGRKVVLNPTLARDALRKIGLSDDDVLRSCEMRVGLLEDVVGETAAKGKKKKSYEKALDALRDVGVLEEKEESAFMVKAKKAAKELEA